MYGLNEFAPAAASTQDHAGSLTREKERQFAAALARAAIHSLYAELTLYPKPGLVSLVDNGSHEDMTAATFMRSLFSLRRYFADIARAGMRGASFTELKSLGIVAEQRMLRATNGVNTHRGAIFCLGMLCAAIGHARARNHALSSHHIRAVLQSQWGQDLDAHQQSHDVDSHGMLVRHVHAVGGARQEAAKGFPAVFEVGLPALRQTLAAGRGWTMARIDALFAIMAQIDDSNVFYRGGCSGAATVKRQASAFVESGGTANPDWKAFALECHAAFIKDRLSPGGAADLLAATCLVHQLSQLFTARQR